jgi:hypothetical protein
MFEKAEGGFRLQPSTFGPDKLMATIRIDKEIQKHKTQVV